MEQNIKNKNENFEFSNSSIKKAKSSKKVYLSQILLNTKNYLMNNNNFSKNISIEEDIQNLQFLENLNNKEFLPILSSPKISIAYENNKSKYSRNRIANSNKFQLKNIIFNSISLDNFHKTIMDSKALNFSIPSLNQEEKNNERKKSESIFNDYSNSFSSLKNIHQNSILNLKKYYFCFRTLSEINPKNKKYKTLKLKENNNKKIYDISKNKILREIILNEYNYQFLNNEVYNLQSDFKYYNKWIKKKLLELKKEIPSEENVHKTFEKEYKNSKYNKPLLNLNSLSVSFNCQGKYHLFHIPFEFLPLFYYKNMNFLKFILASIIKFDNDFEDIYIDFNEIIYMLTYSKEFGTKAEENNHKNGKKINKEKKNSKIDFTSLLNNQQFRKPKKRFTKRKSNNLIKISAEIPTNYKNGAFTPKAIFTIKNNLKLLEIQDFPNMNNNSNEHINLDIIKNPKIRNNNIKNEEEINLYKCKYNKFLFKWNTPKYNYDITVKTPEAIFQLGKTIIKKYIDIELIFYLIENNFNNWDFFISQYLFSYKEWRKNIGKLISVKSTGELFSKELDSFPTLKGSLSTKNMKEIYTKNNKIINLSSEKIHQISDKSRKYEFIYTGKDNINYIKIFHNFFIISRCSSLSKNKFYFDFNFAHMRILNRILKIQGLQYFFKKLIYVDKENLCLKFKYDELSSLSNGNYKMLEKFEPNKSGSKDSLRIKEREEIINLTINFPTLETIKYNNNDYEECFESDYNNIINNGLSLDILDELCKNKYNEWPNIFLKSK